MSSNLKNRVEAIVGVKNSRHRDRLGDLLNQSCANQCNGLDTSHRLSLFETNSTGRPELVLQEQLLAQFP